MNFKEETVTMSPHHSPLEELFQAFSSSKDQGLTAVQAEAAREKYGPNKLAEGRKKTNLQRFFA